jgi:hypothetical protein
MILWNAAGIWRDFATRRKQSGASADSSPGSADARHPTDGSAYGASFWRHHVSQLSAALSNATHRKVVRTP